MTFVPPNDSTFALFGEIPQSESVISTGMTARGPITFTPREAEIVRAILAARSNKDIAQDLGISEQSVKNRLTQLYRKAGVSSRLQLMKALMNSPR